MRCPQLFNKPTAITLVAGATTARRVVSSANNNYQSALAVLSRTQHNTRHSGDVTETHDVTVMTCSSRHSDAEFAESCAASTGGPGRDTAASSGDFPPRVSSLDYRTRSTASLNLHRQRFECVDVSDTLFTSQLYQPRDGQSK